PSAKPQAREGKLFLQHQIAVVICQFPRNAMNPVIDLRSDTVTRPSAGMRAAMAAAEVGDDVFGDDPTVARLEERVAALLGKEAALYVPSGTMSNQLAVNVHTQPGDELLCDVNCHIYNYEAGGPAILSGVTCRTLDGEDRGTAR